MAEHHNDGKPVDPVDIRRALAGLKEGESVWVYLRLRQDPNNVYLGRVKALQGPGGDWRCWRIGTELSFHADPTRWSCLDTGKGRLQDMDEVLHWGVTKVDLFKTTTRGAMTYDEFLAKLKEP